jgi:hypothetical protein
MLQRFQPTCGDATGKIDKWNSDASTEVSEI